MMRLAEAQEKWHTHSRDTVHALFGAKIASGRPAPAATTAGGWRRGIMAVLRYNSERVPSRVAAARPQSQRSRARQVPGNKSGKR